MSIQKNHITELIVGAKASGKSTLIDQRIQSIMHNQVGQTKIVRFNCLDNSKVIDVNKIIKAKKGNFIVGRLQIIQLIKAKAFVTLLNDIKKCHIIIDDFGAIKPDMPREFFTLFVTNRSFERSIILTDLSLKLDLKIIESVDYITMLPLMENVAIYKNLYCQPVLQLMQNALLYLKTKHPKKKTNPHCTLQMDDQLIYGFKQTDYLNSVLDTISKQKRKSIMGTMDYLKFAGSHFAYKKLVRKPKLIQIAPNPNL